MYSFVKLPSVNSPPSRQMLQPGEDCLLNDCSEKGPVMPSSLIHSTHYTVYHKPVVFSSEPDTEKTCSPRLYSPLHEGWKKMNYLKYLVINLKDMVVNGTVVWGIKNFL